MSLFITQLLILLCFSLQNSTHECSKLTKFLQRLNLGRVQILCATRRYLTSSSSGNFVRVKTKLYPACSVLCVFVLAV